MIEVVGHIPDHLLTASKNTPKYFKRSERDNDGDHPKWRLMTEKEYQDKTGIRPESLPWSFKCLDDMVKLKPEVSEPAELEDRKAFVDLLKRLLQMDPERRITPEDALKHPFLTMSHLTQLKTSSPYVMDSFDKMKFCPVSAPEKEGPENQSASGQTVKSRNWRQKFCAFLGPKRTDSLLGPPFSSRAEAVPPERAPDAQSKTWWQKLRLFFRGNGKARRPPPAPRRGLEARFNKTWWYKSCLFFTINRIVPEAPHIPLQEAREPAQVRTHRARDLHPLPERFPLDVRDGASERTEDDLLLVDKSAQINLSEDERRHSSQAPSPSPGTKREPSLVGTHLRLSPDPEPSRTDPAGEARSRRPPAGKREAPPIRKTLTAKWDKCPVRVKAEPSARAKTDQSARVYKLRVKTEPSSPLSKNVLHKT